MIRVYVLGAHPMAWGCVGCIESWWQARRDVREGKDAPPWAMVGELDWEDVRRFRVFAEGRSVSHLDNRTSASRLYVRPSEWSAE